MRSTWRKGLREGPRLKQCDLDRTESQEGSHDQVALQAYANNTVTVSIAHSEFMAVAAIRPRSQSPLWKQLKYGVEV